MRKIKPLGISVVLLCALLGTMQLFASTAGQLEEPPMSNSPARPGSLATGNRPVQLSDQEWLSIRQQIEDGKYRAYAGDDGGFVSANPAHDWQIQYQADGTTRLNPRSPESEPYTLRFKLDAIGYSGLQYLATPGQIIADGNKVTYQWNDSLSEWWVNSEHQLEQWFELKQRPPGNHGGVPLALELTITTGLQLA